MSNLISYAQSELEQAGFFNPDSDYNGQLGKAVMELVETFAAQGHSFFSAYTTIQLFSQLAQFKPLTAITSNPDEWMKIADGYIDGIDDHTLGLWQSKRRPTTFSRDGGQTWYDLEDASLNNGDTWR